MLTHRGVSLVRLLSSPRLPLHTWFLCLCSCTTWLIPSPRTWPTFFLCTYKLKRAQRHSYSSSASCHNKPTTSSPAFSIPSPSIPTVLRASCVTSSYMEIASACESAKQEAEIRRCQRCVFWHHRKLPLPGQHDTHVLHVLADRP